MADSKLSALSEISVPALEDLLYLVDDPAGTPVSVKCSATRAFGILNHVCQGRLTLTSGTPVTTSDVTAASSIYFTPYNGQCVSIYDGTRWRMYVFTELTLALGTLTSGLPYDVFIYDNAGTLTLESLAWTNGTTRATALALQNGVLCKTGALTRRYLGTFYTTSTTQTEDSEGGVTTQVGGKRFVWNMYNRVLRPITVMDTANSWTTTSTAFRQANGATGNKVEFVIGWNDQAVEAICPSNQYASNGSSGIGIDSTSTNSAKLFGEHYQAVGAYSVAVNHTAYYRGFPAVGYHYLAWLEHVTSGTGTFLGDDGGGSQQGLTAFVWG